MQKLTKWEFKVYGYFLNSFKIHMEVIIIYKYFTFY